MLHTLYQRNVRAKTHFFVEWMAIDLVRDADGDVVGVVALEMETGEAMILQAKTTVFATGGAGRIWAASTNAFINTGDGMGMAARAGLPLEDMEFWQFHPTGVAGAGVLITEGVRGEGAWRHDLVCRVFGGWPVAGDCRGRWHGARVGPLRFAAKGPGAAARWQCHQYLLCS
jgi:succinate dehydrogenase/fumarate reductase flavoprotein subunit